MTRPEIAARVASVITDHFAQTGHRPQPGEITDATTFADLGADSLDHIEIVVALEDAFDVECPDEVADELKTVGQLVDFLAGRQAVAA